MRTDPALIDVAMKHVQSPEVALHLADIVIKEFEKVEGFKGLPEPLQEALGRCAAELYGAGFVHGARWTHWRL